MKKFTKKDLIKKLGMDEERANLVMKAQREFPEILLNDGNKFCVNSRIMWEQFGKPQSEYKKWIKRKVLDKNYNENVDFKRTDRIVDMPNNAKKTLVDYYFTINCAKKIGMRENTDKGDLCCDYFIYLEEAIKSMNDWIIIREPEKQGYKEMCHIIDKQYQKSNNGDKPNFYIYSTNADMINLCLFGYKSKTMRQILDVEYNQPLRDNLTSEANKCLYELQQLNSSLVLSNIDFATRKIIVQNTCNERYMNIRIKVISEFNEELKQYK